MKQTRKNNKIWMEFTQLNGKFILMKTIDIGVRHSTRKPKPKPTGNKFPTTPQSEVPTPQLQEKSPRNLPKLT